jgi:hypothetical protein
LEVKRCFVASDLRSEYRESNLPVGEVVQELDGELADNMDIDTPARGFVFDKVREVGRERGDLAKAFQQVPLFPGKNRPKKIKHLDVNEQTGVAHLVSSFNFNSRSRCSGVNQRSGERSLIFRASFVA